MSVVKGKPGRKNASLSKKEEDIIKGELGHIATAKKHPGWVKVARCGGRKNDQNRENTRRRDQRRVCSTNTITGQRSKYLRLKKKETS